MGLDGLFEELKEEECYSLDGLFNESFGNDESSIDNCDDQSKHEITDYEGEESLEQEKKIMLNY